MAMSKAHAQQNWFTETVKTLVTAIGLVLVVHTFLFKPFVIPSPSMYPTLMVGDYLFVSKFTYGYSRYSIPFSPNLFSGRIFESSPKMGDVVVFRPSQDPDTDWIKRVVGLPGDRIRMIEGVLHINGEAVKMEKIGTEAWKNENSQQFTSDVYLETLPNGVVHRIYKTEPFGKATKDNTREFVVPEGHFFMMGDNRDNSGDSRYPAPGYVPLVNIVGRAEIIFFSTDLPTEGGAWWMIWRWPTATRYNRIFNIIR